MRRSHVDAMAALRLADPLEDALRWWTPSAEDALLATVLGEKTLPGSGQREDVAGRAIRPRRLMRVALIALCTIAVGSVALAVELARSGPPDALAAWTPTTTTPATTQLAAAAASCASRYTLMVDHLPRLNGATVPASLPSLALTDSRGPFELLIYNGPTSEGVCLWDSSGVLSVGGGDGETLPAPTDHSIGVPGVGFDRDGGSVLTYAYGHAGAHVTAVTLDLVDGIHVEATVHNGFYAAWWPSQTDVSATEVTTSQGVFQQDFGDVGPDNPFSTPS
jgi:hypothetical protein